MSRGNFGWWGSELDDAGFAQALAALGICDDLTGDMPPQAGIEWVKRRFVMALGGSEVLRWELFHEPIETAKYFKPEAANALQQAWAEAPVQRARLEIQPRTEGQSILPWIIEQLSRNAVGLKSVYVGIKAPRISVRWSWPMRVGLLDDPESITLRRELQNAYWADRFVTFQTAGSVGEPCDLLFLPWTLRRGLGELLRQPHRIRAHCVIVLGGIDDAWDRTHPLLDALLAQVNAAGICVISIPSEKWREWFDHVLRELSHNQFLDVVFRTVAADRDEPAPLFFASEHLLTNSRISNMVQQLVGRLRGMPSETEVSVPEVLRRARDLASELEPYSRDHVYDHEDENASDVAALSGETRRTLTQASPTELRWIQGQVFELGREEGPGRVERALRADARHLLVARIGPADEEWLSPPDEAIFPEHELTWEEDEHELRVVFSEPNHAPEPQTATIILPRQGASTTCQFSFQTRTDISTFQGRVIVLHRNRVLQTALLEGQVVSDPAEAPDELSLQLKIESVIRPVLEDLGARQEFDMAFVANHTSANESGLTTIAHERASFSTTPYLERYIEGISALIEDIADRPEQYPRDLAHGNNERLLVSLARLGRQLYEGIVIDEVGRGKLKNIHCVQLVSAREEYLPLEFLYDLQPPKQGAKLCPHALEVLKNPARKVLKDEKCKECFESDQRPAEHVCPLGFWCMRLVIERHAISPKWRDELDRQDFALLSESIPGRAPLRPLTSALYAASYLVDEVEKGHIEKVFRVLEEGTEQNAFQVDTWEKWKQAVGGRHPSLLVLLPHTSTDNEDEPQLEIGKGKKLCGLDISKDHVRPRNSTAAPVVVLVGCKTLQAHIPFSSFPAYFRRRGAAIVLSTLTSVLGRHAGPVAERLIQDTQKFAKAAEEERSFGYVMLRLRRQALADGLLMVLCLVAHGDADYRFEEPERS